MDVIDEGKANRHVAVTSESLTVLLYYYYYYYYIATSFTTATTTAADIRVLKTQSHSHRRKLTSALHIS